MLLSAQCIQSLGHSTLVSLHNFTCFTCKSSHAHCLPNGHILYRLQVWPNSRNCTCFAHKSSHLFPYSMRTRSRAFNSGPTPTTAVFGFTYTNAPMDKGWSWIEGAPCTRNGIRRKGPDALKGDILGSGTRMIWYFELAYWWLINFFYVQIKIIPFELSPWLSAAATFRSIVHPHIVQIRLRVAVETLHSKPKLWCPSR